MELVFSYCDDNSCQGGSWYGLISQTQTQSTLDNHPRWSAFPLISNAKSLSVMTLFYGVDYGHFVPALPMETDCNVLFIGKGSNWEYEEYWKNTRVSDGLSAWSSINGSSFLCLVLLDILVLEPFVDILVLYHMF